MATSDLANELAKENFKFEDYMANIEKQVTQVVITQLEDQSGDISGLAVKWCALRCGLRGGRGGGRGGIVVRRRAEGAMPCRLLAGSKAGARGGAGGRVGELRTRSEEEGRDSSPLRSPSFKGGMHGEPPSGLQEVQGGPPHTHNTHTHTDTSYSPRDPAPPRPPASPPARAAWACW